MANKNRKAAAKKAAPSKTASAKSANSVARSWAKDMNMFLHGKTDKEIAKATGRNAHAVYNKRRALIISGWMTKEGLPGKNHPDVRAGANVLPSVPRETVSPTLERHTAEAVQEARATQAHNSLTGQTVTIDYNGTVMTIDPSKYRMVKIDDEGIHLR